MKNKELDNILDQVTAGIRAEQVDDTTVGDATERVWARLSTETSARKMRANRPQDAGAPAVVSIEGCADFQTLIPAYLGPLLRASLKGSGRAFEALFLPRSLAMMKLLGRGKASVQQRLIDAAAPTAKTGDNKPVCENA